MSVIDIETLLQEIDPEAPSGEDLEYDPDFGELERAAQPTAEQQLGDSVVRGAEPDWRDVRDRSIALLGRTKDLRVATCLTRALLGTEGMGGLNEGLALIRGLLETHWETVHPRLDPDDDNDPTMRMNTLATLCDYDAFLRGVREAPIVESRGFGRFSMRDIAIASGSQPAPEGDHSPPEMSAVDGAFSDTDAETLEATAGAVAGAIESLTEIENYVTGAVGAASALSLSDLRGILSEIQQALAPQLARRGIGDATTAAAGDEDAGANGAGAPKRAAAPGQINSRQDVIRMLDRVCDYYYRNEPSSPVPMLLRRAKGLVMKDFLDIVRDITPDGVMQAEMLRGQEEEYASPAYSDYSEGADYAESSEEQAEE